MDKICTSHVMEFMVSPVWLFRM